MTVDRKYLMRLKRETSVLKSLRRSVHGTDVRCCYKLAPLVGNCKKKTANHLHITAFAYDARSEHELLTFVTVISEIVIHQSDDCRFTSGTCTLL